MEESVNPSRVETTWGGTGLWVLPIVLVVVSCRSETVRLPDVQPPQIMIETAVVEAPGPGNTADQLNLIASLARGVDQALELGRLVPEPRGVVEQARFESQLRTLLDDLEVERTNLLSSGRLESMIALVSMRADVEGPMRDAHAALAGRPVPERADWQISAGERSGSALEARAGTPY